MNVKQSPKPETSNMTARQLWDKANPLHPHFIEWLKGKGIAKPYDMGRKPAKQKASRFLNLLRLRKAA